jgi:hypothetical protein
MKTQVSLSILVLLFFIGCSSSSKKENTPKLMPLSFDFKPTVDAGNQSNEITFGLIAPSFVETFTEKNKEPYKTYAKNMERDFIEMLTARGYRYKGPFNSLDELVYSDKKEIDLLINPTIDLQFTGNPLKQGTYHDYSQGKDFAEYYYEGEVSMTGTMNLTFAEPFTNTKIWVKSVNTDPTSFMLKSGSYTAPQIPDTDPLVWNSLVTNMEKTYQRTLQMAWNHLEPAELLQKKAESVEIKKNSGFIKN